MDFEEEERLIKRDAFVQSTRKQGTNPLKRKLILSLVFGCIVIAFIFNLTEMSSNAIGSFNAARLRILVAEPQKDRNSSPQWTWICQNSSCVRKQDTNSIVNRQSLETCNVLCGSTLLWPQPTGPVRLSSKTVPVRANDFSLIIDKSSSAEVTEYLNKAFTLMKEDLLKLDRKTSKGLINFDDADYKKTEVHISVESDSDPRIRLNTDESYELTMKTVNDTLEVKINARSFCGARHGMETLSQLIWMDSYLESLLALDAVDIQDAPRFKIRGLLLDTARNYFPVSDILRTIDGMAANKLNTFHWHATDSQSFPLKLRSAPELAKYGAYSAKQIYTREDIRSVVHRGRVRGIRIIIEIDAPAHVGRAWSYGPASSLGDLAYCIDKEPWRYYCGEPPCGQLNPTNPHVYNILEKIYKEIIDLTGEDEMFHIGGDEVREQCWQKSLNLTTTTPRLLWLNFTKQSLERLEKANGGKLPEVTIIWSSKLTHHPYLEQLDSKKLTIQLWGASDWLDMKNILDAGFRTIISHVDAWYLDCGFGGWRDASLGHCGPYRRWQVVYGHRPWTNRKPSWRIEGGTACQWTELMGPEVTDARLWPRGAALGERLWTDPENQVTADVTLRIDTQRSRMFQRGIGAEPIWPRWCSQNPSACL